jgi:hypothetical protein
MNFKFHHLVKIMVYLDGLVSLYWRVHSKQSSLFEEHLLIFYFVNLLEPLQIHRLLQLCYQKFLCFILRENQIKMLQYQIIEVILTFKVFP